jgi:hypothetical protein
MRPTKRGCRFMVALASACVASENLVLVGLSARQAYEEDLISEFMGIQRARAAPMEHWQRRKPRPWRG